MITLARDLHEAGCNLSTIGRRLAEAGYLDRGGRPFRTEQVKRLLPDYTKAFSHTSTKLSGHIRGFIEIIA